MRHRMTLQDVAFVIGVILLVGLGAYEYSFMNSVAEEKRVEFEEMLVLGALVVISILYLGWRRVREQEREIRRRVAAERRAHELAHTDPLTGLANRREFESKLQAACSTPLAPNEVHGVLMLDLTHFKKVNDVYGHAEGDDLLAGIAEQLRSVVRGRDVVARLGGDEFAVIAHHLAGPEGASNTALRVMKAIEQPVQIGPHTHNVGTGIGIALIPRDGTTAADVLRKADIALYRAKSEPESTIRFFEGEMDRHLRERDSIERALRRAVGTDALRPWYQPVIDLKSDKVVGFEALARWNDPVLGSMPPERFIPIAESSRLIVEVSTWLLRCACKDAMRWPLEVMLSFNISPVELRDRGLAQRILAVLSEVGLPPRRLEVEITESAIVQDMEAAQEVLGALRDAGVNVAVDDFGTGYSSLHHLRTFKLDKVKIDRSFVHAMNTEAESAAIVRALTGLGNGLGLTVVAEGIEASGERDTLLGQGCQQGQGFLFSEAVPAERTAAFLAADRAKQIA